MDPALATFLVSDSGRDVTQASIGMMKWVGNLLGGPLRVRSEIAQDSLEYRKWENRVRLMVKAKELMEAHDIAARVLPPGFLLPLLDAVGNVEDETLEKLWAGLLTSACKDDLAHPAFVETLRQLTPDEAKMLLGLRDRSKVAAIFTGMMDTIKIWEGSAEIAQRVGPLVYRAYCDNLDRLGILPNVGMPDHSFEAEYKALNARYANLLQSLSADTDQPGLHNYFNGSSAELTRFGQLFLRACDPRFKPVQERR